MSLVLRLLAWAVAALVAATAYWSVAVYLLGEYDRGYGKSNWFLLQLYLSAIGTPVGLVGYAAVSALRGNPGGGILTAVAAGAGFTLGVRLATNALRLALPDFVVSMPWAAVGLLIAGALSPLAARLKGP